MKNAFQNDSELLMRIKVHDNEAFEALYRKYWKNLFDFATIKTGDADAAEEIIQELFVTLWEKRETLQITNLQSYLFTSVRNRVIDHYKQKVFDELDTAEASTTPDYPLFLDELETALHAAVSELPDKTREIFLLNRFEGKTARQIAQELNLPERTVEYHITQALRTLKTQLRDFIVMLALSFGNSIF